MNVLWKQTAIPLLLLFFNLKKSLIELCHGVSYCALLPVVLVVVVVVVLGVAWCLQCNAIQWALGVCCIPDTIHWRIT